MKLQAVTWENGNVVLIDQTRLPAELVYVRCRTLKQVWHAIRTLQVRGAPAIGAAAGLGMVLGLSSKKYAEFKTLKKQADKVVSYLESSRPTAINLSWALNRIKKVIIKNRSRSIRQIKKLILEEALAIMEEERRRCSWMADNAQCLIKGNDRILTYCNTGFLATIGCGTALGAIYRAKELKKKIKVYACETRPLLQGARLTCWELHRKDIDVTLICDNMAGYLMQQKKIDKVFIGADRIAANGDTANKIGSYSLAVLANFHNIPFYVVAPSSTFDFKIKNGRQIPIEERAHAELRKGWFKQQIVPSKVKVYNPAFDVIPNNLITGIVSENSLLKPPYSKKIQVLRKNNQHI